MDVTPEPSPERGPDSELIASEREQPLAVTGPTERLATPVWRIPTTQWRGWLMTVAFTIATLAVAVQWETPQVDPYLVGVSICAILALTFFATTVLSRNHALLVNETIIRETDGIGATEIPIAQIAGVSMRMVPTRYSAQRYLVLWDRHDRVVHEIDLQSYRRRDVARLLEWLRDCLPALQIEREVRHWFGIA